MTWLHYADHALDPIRRSSNGSNVAIADTLGIFSRKHAVDDYRVIVEVGIEQSAEAVDEDDGAEACLAARRHQTMPQTTSPRPSAPNSPT